MANSKSTLLKKLNKERKNLPIYHFRGQLLNAIEKYQVLVIGGFPGCGATTQIPQYLHEAGYTKSMEKKIAVTLPRGVAHIMPSVAAKVAREIGAQLGHEVAYSLPPNSAKNCDIASNNVSIKYMTDGILVNEILGRSADLESYSVVMVEYLPDERTVSAEILFALLKNITQSRPFDFKVLISCSTESDQRKLSDYFDSAPVFPIPGRYGLVDIHQLMNKTGKKGLVNSAVNGILEFHLMHPPGDILVFLPGQEEILRAYELLKGIANVRGHDRLIICSMYPIADHCDARVSEATPRGCTKVVFATNVAETSLLMLNNFRYVIDFGLCMMKRYDPTAGVEMLRLSPVSKEVAILRAAAAPQDGTRLQVYRFYTQDCYMGLRDQTAPEVQRNSPVNVVLVLKRLGFRDVLGFRFLDPPDHEAMVQAVKWLIEVGALGDELGQLTQIGKQMAEKVLLSM